MQLELLLWWHMLAHWLALEVAVFEDSEIHSAAGALIGNHACTRQVMPANDFFFFLPKPIPRARCHGAHVCWFAHSHCLYINLLMGHIRNYVMESNFQWKPFWLATQLYPENDWTGWQFRVNYDVFAQAPLEFQTMHDAQWRSWLVSSECNGLVSGLRMKPYMFWSGGRETSSVLTAHFVASSALSEFLSSNPHQDVGGFFPSLSSFTVHSHFPF